MLEHPWSWLIVGLLSILFNVMPILAPPTWAMLAYFHVQYDQPFIAVVLIGAIGSTAGRVLLALACRRFGTRFVPAKRLDDVQSAITRIREQKRLSLPLLGLFAVGPVPKALLFMAAGMARIPLAPGAAVFGVARAVTYGVTLTATNQVASSLSEIITSPVGGPLLVATQLGSMLGLFLLFRVDLPKMGRNLVRSVRWVARRVAISQA